MKKRTDSKIQAHLIRRAYCFLMLVATCASPFAVAQQNAGKPNQSSLSEQTLSYAERVAYQRVIEDVYWRHRSWPNERSDPKPPLDAVLSRTQLEKKVADYLCKSQALQDYWQRPITAEQLQGEINRMAQQTKQREVLRELFEALGNDPFVIAECLARPVLTDRLIADLSDQQQTGRVESLRTAKVRMPEKVAAIESIAQAVRVKRTYQLPEIGRPSAGCLVDTWTPTTLANAPHARYLHTAVWTGSEMIIWGGDDGISGNTGGRYNPSTDSWTATSTTNAPSGRLSATAVWTGSEMIVWGGSVLNTGGRYNPVSDSWTATSTTNAPHPRELHTAVWTGSEMIVWGGGEFGTPHFNTGGRYNPVTDSWTATSTTNAPDGREYHTAVWTGTEMIVWGGAGDSSDLNTGGRYNPVTDSWTATSTTNAPHGRESHTAVWTDSEMIVWGGSILNTGGRYNPGTDVWVATNIANVPEARYLHSAVWTGSEMIIWGGADEKFNLFNTGGRYNPSTDNWTATSTTNAPEGRVQHTAVWTGSEMIVWGGGIHFGVVNTGGRYCAPTPRASPTPRPRPTPAPRP